MAELVKVYPETFESAMNDILDIDYAETECDDFRIDFLDGYSLWLRSGTAVEGAAPPKYKVKINKVIRQLGVKNYVEYR